MFPDLPETQHLRHQKTCVVVFMYGIFTVLVVLSSTNYCIRIRTALTLLYAELLYALTKNTTVQVGTLNHDYY